MIGIAGDDEAGGEVERVSRSYSVLDQAEGYGLAVVPILLIALVVLVDGCSLRSRAVGIEEQRDVQLERPSLVDNIGKASAGVVRGNDGMDRRALIDVLFVERRSYFKVLIVRKIDILGDRGGYWSQRCVDIAGDLEVMR